MAENNLITTPITADDVKLIEHTDLGGTYRSIMTVKGKKFKRLMGRLKPYTIVWHDEDYQLGNVPIIDNELYNNILEHIFQKFCVCSTEIKSTRDRG